MTVDTCPVCARRPADLGMACTACRDTARRRLDDLDRLYTDACAEIAPGGGTGGRGGALGVGVRLSALDYAAGHDIVAALDSWAQDWREIQGHSRGPVTINNAGLPIPTVTLAAALTYLGAHLTWAAAEHPAFDEFAHELASLHAAAKVAARVADAPVHVVTCPTDIPTDDGWGACGRRLTLVDIDLDAHVRCDDCRTTWTVRRLLMVAATDATAEVWVAEEDAALVWGVAQSTLRKWARQGRVQRRRGHYEVGSVRREVEAAVHDGRLGQSLGQTP